MSTTIKATFEVASWNEEQFDERDGHAKLTEAIVERTYAGDIEGSSVTRWLMAYAPDETAKFVGIERLVGTVGGKAGSVVLQHVGAFENGSADAELIVVSGTGDLEGVTGSGSFTADPAGKLTLSLT